MSHKKSKSNGNGCHGDYLPTDNEHIANIATHALTVPFSILAMLVLCIQSSTLTHFYTAVIYGLSMNSLFCSSTWFHWDFYKYKRISPALQKLDRSAIYLFIASSVFPWSLLMKIPPNVIMVDAKVIYTVAILGVIFELIYGQKYAWLSVIFYVAIGVIPGIFAYIQFTFDGSTELIIGGVLFIVGVAFYSSDGKLLYAHAIWHIFATLGSAFHFYAIYANLYAKRTHLTSY